MDMEEVFLQCNSNPLHNKSSEKELRVLKFKIIEILSISWLIINLDFTKNTKLVMCSSSSSNNNFKKTIKFK